MTLLAYDKKDCVMSMMLTLIMYMYGTVNQSSITRNKTKNATRTKSSGAYLCHPPATCVSWYLPLPQPFCQCVLHHHHRDTGTVSQKLVFLLPSSYSRLAVSIITGFQPGPQGSARPTCCGCCCGCCCGVTVAAVVKWWWLPLLRDGHTQL